MVFTKLPTIILRQGCLSNKKLSFFPGGAFQTCLMFASKAGAYKVQESTLWLALGPTHKDYTMLEMPTKDKH